MTPEQHSQWEVYVVVRQIEVRRDLEYSPDPQTCAKEALDYLYELEELESGRLGPE